MVADLKKGEVKMERTTADYAKKFGENLSNIMYERHITQAQLAQELKIPKGTIYNWTHGLRLPRAAAMDALCRHLQISRADLLDDDPNGSSPTTELTADMAREVFGPQESPQAGQEPAGDIADDDLQLALDALDAAGYGHLRALVKAAAGADQKSIDFVTEILKRNKK